MKTEMVLLVFNSVVSDNRSGNCVQYGVCLIFLEGPGHPLSKEEAKEHGSGESGLIISHIRPEDSVSFLCGKDWQKGQPEFGSLQGEGWRQCQWSQCSKKRTDGCVSAHLLHYGCTHLQAFLCQSLQGALERVT